MKKSHIISCVFLLVSLFGYAQKETRTIDSFKSIEVGESINVYITKGSSNKAIIETDGVSSDKVQLDVFGNNLKIHMKSGNWRNFDASVFLEFQELEEIEVSSSADLIGKSIITGDELEITVTSSGKATLMVDVNNLEVEVSSSGKLELTGKANYQEVDVSSSGKLYAYDLISKKAKIEVSSSGKAEINASQELDAEANSSGKVSYKGSPEKIYISANSSGKISKN
ncbi:MAG: DUF2807 domain-containing protein [Bacteroidetes bacterium]|nr:DUF2807 domain-containing protein [Bacteroidota bacterium]MDA1120250.1 DUF2807 domain-containing protein [Bacteroidota bacterium]